MRGLRKKLVALTAVAAMAVTSLAGCASVKNNEVVATVGESEITAGVANFYTRYVQATQGLESTLTMYESYGYAISDMESSFKESIMSNLQVMYILKNHMADYDVVLTEDENAAIDAAAEAFLKANSDKIKEKVSGEKSIAVEVLELITIQEKMYEAMKTGETDLVKDEDIAQKAMKYVLFATTTTDETTGSSVDMTDEEKEAQKTAATEFLTNAKANGSLETYAEEAQLEVQGGTFDSENEGGYPEEIIEVADVLELNGFSDVIETDSGYVVVQLTSLFDEDATNEKRYEAILELWKEATEIEVNEKVWKKISLDKLGVTAKEEEVADDAADTTEDTVEDATENVAEDTVE